MDAAKDAAPFNLHVRCAMKKLMKFTALILMVTIITGCCNTLGSRWFGSCGIRPTTSDMHIVAECLEKGNKVGTNEYTKCLESKNIVHGF